MEYKLLDHSTRGPQQPQHTNTLAQVNPLLAAMPAAYGTTTITESQAAPI